MFSATLKKINAHNRHFNSGKESYAMDLNIYSDTVSVI